MFLGKRNDNTKIKIDIPQFLDESLTPFAKECGERLSDIVNLIFTPVIMTRALRDKHLEIFLRELNIETKKIPEENVQYPPINIVGPALEDVLKYYCNVDVIRKMFVKLIAAAMNKKSNVHPAFGEIIKQLSRYELALLRYFWFSFDNGVESSFHLNVYSIFYSVDEDWLQASYFILYRQCVGKPAVLSPNKLIMSLLNLQRLSLIYIRDMKGIRNDIDIEIDDFKVKRTDGKRQKYTSIEVMETRFLENFMNTCYSRELDQNINIDMIFDGGFSK